MFMVVHSGWGRYFRMQFRYKVNFSLRGGLTGSWYRGSGIRGKVVESHTPAAGWILCVYRGRDCGAESHLDRGNRRRLTGRRRRRSPQRGERRSSPVGATVMSHIRAGLVRGVVCGRSQKAAQSGGNRATRAPRTAAVVVGLLWACLWRTT